MLQTLVACGRRAQVRMQADGRLVAAGLQAAPRYRGVAHAARVIMAQEGLAGLWRGSAPAIQRAALVNLGELTTYDQVGGSGRLSLWWQQLPLLLSGLLGCACPGKEQTTGPSCASQQTAGGPALDILEQRARPSAAAHHPPRPLTSPPHPLCRPSEQCCGAV